VSIIDDFLHAIPYDQLLIQTLNGIVTGMILALIASGLTLIFGIMDVINFAHGELFMFGAYLGVIVLTTGGSFWLALLLATLIVAVIGAALQIATLRPLLVIARAGDTGAAARVARADSVRQGCLEARAFAMNETEQGLAELRALPAGQPRELLAQLVKGLIQRKS